MKRYREYGVCLKNDMWHIVNRAGGEVIQLPVWKNPFRFIDEEIYKEESKCASV